MANPNEKTGVIATLADGGETGTLAPDGGGANENFKNPVMVDVTVGDRVVYINIVNAKTGETIDIITGSQKDS